MNFCLMLSCLFYYEIVIYSNFSPESHLRNKHLLSGKIHVDIGFTWSFNRIMKYIKFDSNYTDMLGNPLNSHKVDGRNWFGLCGTLIWKIIYFFLYSIRFGYYFEFFGQYYFWCFIITSCLYTVLMSSSLHIGMESGTYGLFTW